MNKLELKGVSYVYGKGTPFEKCALNNVSIGFEAGKITGLIGHTGSGKSTLVNMLNGLIKPTSGEVLLDGVNIWSKGVSISDVRFKVGLVMQYPEHQLFEDTVELDIGFGPKNQGKSPEEIRERVLDVIKFTGIGEDMLSRSPFDLSGGQKRRVAIAGILAMQPDVLVLDEPAAGLDPRGRREILGGLCRYVRERGLTLILVSHSMEDMAYYCDNVVVMSNAEVYRSGSVEQIFSVADDLESVGLDVPMITRIASRLRAKGIALEGRLYTVEGVRDAILRLAGGTDK